MENTPIAIAEAYYNAISAKDSTTMEKYLHPDVQFIGPLATMTGKEAVLGAGDKFFAMFKTLTIRTKLASDDNQAMIVMDLDCPPPVGHFRSANLVTVEDNLITKIELFYDARPFEQKEIFS